MALPKILSLSIRVAQIFLATIVLGLTGYFLHHRNKFSQGDDEIFGRLLFSVIISVTSLTHSLSTLLSPTPTLLHLTLDTIFTISYFTIFALLTDSYADNLACQSLFSWANLDLGAWRDTCAQWNAAQAFSFLAGVVWGLGVCVGGLGWLRGRRERRAGVNGVEGGDAGERPVVVNGDSAIAPRRRWFGKRRA